MDCYQGARHPGQAAQGCVGAIVRSHHGHGLDLAGQVAPAGLEVSALDWEALAPDLGAAPVAQA